MADPQPGLLPIIPPLPPQPGPSPLIPVIVLLIVVSLRWALLRMLEMRNVFEVDTSILGVAMESLQSHLSITAVLIPVCLLLAIQAFGMPRVNAVRNVPPESPLLKAITRNFWSSLLLAVIVMALLLSIPIRSILYSPFTPSGSAWGWVQDGPGVCQELGILQRRCENWKGSSRNSVCRELALLQKRCERSYF